MVMYCLFLLGEFYKVFDSLKLLVGTVNFENYSLKLNDLQDRLFLKWLLKHQHKKLFYLFNYKTLQSMAVEF